MSAGREDGPGLGARIFSWALRLFPRWFRDAYGATMLDDFRMHHRRIHAADGSVAALRFVVRSVAAVPSAAMRALHDGPPNAERAGGLGALRDDVRSAARSLARAPGWTGASLFILSVGIGGTAALFSVIDAVILRPLPYDEPDRLVSLWTVNRTQDLRDGSSWENSMDWRDRSRALEDVTLIVRPEFTTGTLSSFDEPERVHAGLVDGRFFELLGVAAVAGRTFSAEDLGGDGRVAVISESLWVGRYARSEEAIGSTVTVDGADWRVVGVAPGTLALPRRETRIWLLTDFRPPPERSLRGNDSFWVIGRLSEGATPESAQRELDAVAAELSASFPETNRNRGVRLRTLQSEIVGERVPLLLWTLLGSMALVLVVGGANVAQLMIGRGVERRREIAVRASLGASRARVNRQLLLEGVMLSVGAGVGGTVIAAVGLQSLLGIIPPDMPLVERTTVDASVLLISFAVAGVLAPLVGLLPSLSTSRIDAATLLRGGSRAGSSRGERRLRALLVVGEVALAVVLLSGAGLLVRSAAELAGVDPGFDARSTLMARVDLSSRDRSEVSLRATELEEELRRLPGVEGVARIGAFFISRIPDQTIRLVGSPSREEGAPTPQLTSDVVAPGFFAELGVPLLRGRELGPSDLRDEGPYAMVVNRAWVEAFAGDRDPVGLQFRWGDQDPGPGHTVVGVVGDLSRTLLEETPYPQLFMPGVTASFDLLVRTTVDPVSIGEELRSIVHRKDPVAAVSNVGTAWERYGDGMAQREFQTFLFGLFSALATMLAAVGLFAVLHEAVSSRRREFGIRLALGAAPAGVRRLVVGRGLGLTVVGVAVGMAVTVGLSGIMGRMVYGITSTDPATLAVVVVAVLGIAVAASAVPAVQATRVSPSETLTGE